MTDLHLKSVLNKHHSLPRRLGRCGLVIYLLFFGTFMLSTSAFAQNAPYLMDSPTYVANNGLSLQALGTESGFFDSNPLLLTTKTKSLFGSITSPELVFSNKTPNADIISDTIFSSNNFNQSTFNSNDVHSKLALARDTERWTTSIQGGIDYDTTRSSEVSAYNNIRTTPIRHTGESLAPQIGYSYTSVDRLNLATSYTGAQYANKVYTNYNSYSVTPSYTHDFDPRNSGIFSFQAQRYQSVGGSTNITDTVGPSIGWKTIFTERLTANAAIGAQESRQRTATTQDAGWKAQYNYSGGLDYKGEQDLLSLHISRSQYPFGNGTEALLSQFSINETHSLNELISLGVLGSYESATYQADAAGNLKSLVTGGGNITYHATNRLDIAAIGQYERETLDSISADARKFTGILSITYHPQAWAF